MLDAVGKIVLQRHRPYYDSKAKAEADKPSIREQHEKTGSGGFLFNRNAAEDYESALKMVGGVPLIEIAKFWRLHHPDKPKRKLAELLQAFLADVKIRHGEGRHHSDLKSRGGAFIAAGFGERYADTITLQEILAYVKGLSEADPRTTRNHKTAICEFLNRLVQEAHEVLANPAAGIKKRMLPKEIKQRSSSSRSTTSLATCGRPSATLRNLSPMKSFSSSPVCVSMTKWRTSKPTLFCPRPRKSSYPRASRRPRTERSSTG